jgi:hypothetical protein
MPRLTAMDEQFVHQIPEPLPAVVSHHPHWRESLFFIMHPREGVGDVVILTLAHFPAVGIMDSLQLGTVGGQPAIARHVRPYDGDPHTMAVGPVSIDIAEPYRTVRLHVADDPTAALSMDITFEARTAPCPFRRGTMKAGHEIIWDQSHFVQSGEYRGHFVHRGQRHDVDGWWGQRDHSWGIRDHARVPFWMWLAIQLPDGMLSLWHWELANGARVYTDGAWAPLGGGAPVPVVDARHDLRWLDGAGAPVSYGRDGSDVEGIAGRVELVLEGGEVVGLEAQGRWAQRYGPRGGGLSLVSVRTDDGRDGTAIYELTGAHHHRYFPEARAERLPPEEAPAETDAWA